MDHSSLESIILSYKEVTKEYPFDLVTAVYKVRGKMFALMGEKLGDSGVNLKCNPIEAGNLRSAFEGITPGYHMNKMHWNTVDYNSDVPDDLIALMVKNSYELVVLKMNKKAQKELL